MRGEGVGDEEKGAEECVTRGETRGPAARARHAARGTSRTAAEESIAKVPETPTGVIETVRANKGKTKRSQGIHAPDAVLERRHRARADRRAREDEASPFLRRVLLPLRRFARRLMRSIVRGTPLRVACGFSRPAPRKFAAAAMASAVPGVVTAHELRAILERCDGSAGL